MDIDFSRISNSDLINMAENACGIYDGLRIFGQGDLSELVAPAKQVWDAVRQEIESRGLGRGIGL